MDLVDFVFQMVMFTKAISVMEKWMAMVRNDGHSYYLLALFFLKAGCLWFYRNVVLQKWISVRR
jgi:hypothetical protein